MDRAAWALVAVAAVLFVAPLAYFDELAVWTFDHEVSNLEWDEKGVAPDAEAQAAATSGGSGTTDTSTDGSGGGGSGGDSSGGGSSSESTESGSASSGSSADASSGSGSGALGSASGTGGSSDGGWGFVFGLGSFSLVVGGGVLFWSSSCYAAWAAFAQAWAAWTLGLVCALAALFFAALWTAFGVVGGLVAAGGVLLVVYLHSQGLILQGSATAAAPSAPSKPPRGKVPRKK